VSVRLAVADIVRMTGGRIVAPAGAAAPEMITGVTTDSRRARPGDLFVALRGPHADGHAFAADALAHGAVLAVVADPGAAAGPALVVVDPLRALGQIAALHRAAMPTTVVGITGSVGKTTTVGLCARVLEARFQVARSAESWNAELGVALTLLGLEARHDVAVIEMAMRGLGQIRELVELARPRIGAVTTIADTHLETLGSREHIAAAKAELLEGLPPDGVAIVNADEALTVRLLRDVPCPVVRFGLSPEADVRATEVRRANGGYAFRLSMGGEQVEASLPLPGAHQVRNALVAAAVGAALGVGPGEIVTGLGRARPAKMRQEVLEVDDLLIIDDSYNASPQSMQAAFEVLAQVGGRRRRVLALGEMRELGPRSPEFHRQVGHEAAALAPGYLLAVGSQAQGYVEGATAAGLPASAAAVAETADAAIPLLRQVVRPGDVVLIKGSRAIEMERLVAALTRTAPVSHS
jgi:UDP-N-acetylmuramoyl-tripeptide--D-alanyl-D-alanine ligase